MVSVGMMSAFVCGRGFAGKWNGGGISVALGVGVAASSGLELKTEPSKKPAKRHSMDKMTERAIRVNLIFLMPKD
jgi:hypothetical protein